MGIARDLNISVPANTDQTIVASGAFVYLKRTNVDVTVEVNAGTIVMTQGDKVSFPDEFADFRVKNNTGITANITVVVGDGDFAEGNLTSEISVTKNTTLTTTADNSVGAGLQENVSATATTKRIVMISNLSSTADLRVGDSNTAAARGQPLPAGMTLTMETSDDVYVFNNTGGAVLVAVTEIHD